MKLRQETLMGKSKSSTPRWLLPALIMCAIVLLFANWAPLDTPAERLKAQKARAQLGCAQIATAVEAYSQSPVSPSSEQQAELWRHPKPHDLINPPWGGPSFLRNGEKDLIDPWGKQFQIERVLRSDGSEFILVTTTAPDGTPISQFGIGPNARPQP